MATKAFTLLSARKSTESRAAQYAERVADSILLTKINHLKEAIGKIDDKIFDLENFSLETDINAGFKQISKEDIENRFSQLIDLHYEKDLIQAELDSKAKAFELYFGKVQPAAINEVLTAEKQD